MNNLGPGRPAATPSIDKVRELTAEEVAATPHGREPAVKNLRDSHHMVARLFAMGLRSAEVAYRTGYSQTRVCILQKDPAFKELIADYRDSVDEAWKESVDEYFETLAANRIISARRLNDLLTDDSAELGARELVMIHSDAADRTGYGKRSTQVNLNVDFAAQLDRAITRSNAARSGEAAPVCVSNTEVQPRREEGAVAGRGVVIEGMVEEGEDE